MGLTVKHVEAGQHEAIQCVSSVSWNPETKELHAWDCSGQKSVSAIDEHGHCCYASGIVYVMNENGSTVGTYDIRHRPATLDDSETPARRAKSYPS